jgi:plastocyanin
MRTNHKGGLSMKKYLVLAVVSLAFYAAPAALAAPANVAITATGFNPTSVSIEQAESVTWTNNDQTTHRVVVTGTECDLALRPNQRASCTFGTTGTFNYRDPGETETGFRGTITVTRAPDRRVSLDAGVGQDNIVIFGGAVTLTGFVTSNQSGETVTIIADPLGLDDPPRRINVTTGGDGEWTLRVQPRVRTAYKAEWRGAESRVLNVHVRPRVGIRKVGRNLFTVTVVAGGSFAGKQVIIRRQRTRTDRRWRIVRRVLLREHPRTSTISQRTFRLVVPRGFRMRVLLTAREAGPAYLSSQSNIIRA